ncbi:zinc-binding dehydrogenase [Micromonospora musae]
MHPQLTCRASTLLAEARELGRQGRHTPRVARPCPLEQAAEAHAYAERGHTRGRLAVRT